MAKSSNRRGRLLKWGAILFLSLVTLLICGEIYWQKYTQRRLEKVISAIQARGEPINPQDFTFPAIADADNAAG